MGWWKSGNGENIIGDSPVDRILNALKLIANSCTNANQSKPTLEMILSIVAAALKIQTDLLISDPETVPEIPVVKMMMRNRSVISIDSKLKNIEPDVVSQFHSTLEDIAVDYLGSELNRKPKLSEVLACLTFVLRVEAVPYLEGVSGELNIDRIVVIEGRAT